LAANRHKNIGADAWTRWFGTKRPWVRISPLRP